MDESRGEAFRVLGIPVDSDQEAVAHAYRRLARATHPDVSSDPGAADRFAAIAAAYRFLSADPRTTSISVRVAAPAPASHEWTGSGNVDDCVSWVWPVALSWSAPTTGRREGWRRDPAPIVAGPAWVSPLGGSNESEVSGG